MPAIHVPLRWPPRGGRAAQPSPHAAPGTASPPTMPCSRRAPSTARFSLLSSFSVSFILSTVSKTPPNFANQQAVTAHTFTPLEECVECACVCESGTRAQRWSIGQNWHPNFVSYYYYHSSTVEVARGRQRAAETPTSWRTRVTSSSNFPCSIANISSHHHR